MNVKQAAVMLGVSAGKVYQLAAPHGPIPCTRIGKPALRNSQLIPSTGALTLLAALFDAP